MALPAVLSASEVKTPEKRPLFGTAEAVPWRQRFMRWWLLRS